MPRNLKPDLVQYAYRKHYGDVRKEKITGIIIHHADAVWTTQQALNFFTNGSRWVSPNFTIGNDGLLGLSVPENYRPHTTNGYHDESNITVEVCNSSRGGTYPVSDKALKKLIELVAYVCLKYGLEPSFTGNTKGTIRGHYMYEATACPGAYLKSKMKYIEQEARKLMKLNKPQPKPPAPGKTLHRVQVGAFKVKDNAIKREADLKRKGYDTYLILADGLYKVQVGAYANKSNADKMAAKLKKDGYSIFMTTKGGTAVTAKKTLAELAAEVYAGKWGNGKDRYTRLTNAGYDYDAVQAEVNRRYY